MKVLILFLMGTFIVAVGAANRGRPSRAWVLLGVTVLVSTAYLARRAY